MEKDAYVNQQFKKIQNFKFVKILHEFLTAYWALDYFRLHFICFLVNLLLCQLKKYVITENKYITYEK